MRTRAVFGALTAVVVVTAAAGCTGDDADDTAGDSGFPVRFLAGGGSTAASETPVPAEDVRLDGRVTDLTEGVDGAVWGLVEGTGVLRVADGAATVVTPRAPGPLSDVEVAPDGTVYVTLDEPAEGSPAVHVLGEDGSLQPAFGVVATGAELAGTAPVSPDGTAAESAVLGPVTDLAVSDDGTVTFVEQVVPAGLQAVSLVRRVESDGSLTTIAGGTPAPGEEPTPEDVAAALHTDAGSARELPVLGPAYVAVDGEDTYLQGFNALVRIDAAGAVSVLLGNQGAEGGVLPSRAPFGDPVPGTEFDYRGNLDLGPSAADGRVLAMAIGAGALDDDQIEEFGWRLDGGSDHAAELAGGASSAAEPVAAVLVDGDGDATTASVIGTDALLTADGSIVAAGWDAEAGETVLVGYPAED